MRIDPDTLEDIVYIQTKERICDHEIGDSKKFCPECGAPIYETVSNPIDGYDEEEDTLFGFKLLRVSSENKDTEFIAFVSEETDDSKIASLGSNFNLVEIKEHMRSLLEPLGLFYEESFGIHAFLYESC